MVFTLHPSFANHIRGLLLSAMLTDLTRCGGVEITVVEEPPYEVSETGWGEFEVKIR